MLLLLPLYKNETETSFYSCSCPVLPCCVIWLAASFGPASPPLFITRRSSSSQFCLFIAIIWRGGPGAADRVAARHEENVQMQPSPWRQSSGPQQWLPQCGRSQLGERQASAHSVALRLTSLCPSLFCFFKLLPPSSLRLPKSRHSQRLSLSCSESLLRSTPRKPSSQSLHNSSVHSEASDASLLSSLLDESSIKEHTLVDSLWGKTFEFVPSVTSILSIFLLFGQLKVIYCESMS